MDMVKEKFYEKQSYVTSTQGVLVKGQQQDRFIYIVGEQQNGIIPENPKVFSFTEETMHQIETGELALVLANVFARGQYFPGPEGALTSVLHEFTRRSERFNRMKSRLKQGRCTIITAFRRLDGEISVKVAAVVKVRPGSLDVNRPEGFHQLLIATMPEYQDVFTEEAYAMDSKVIDLIKATALYHIDGQLQ
jgi:hypothetical protein